MCMYEGRLEFVGAVADLRRGQRLALQHMPPLDAVDADFLVRCSQDGYG